MRCIQRFSNNLKLFLLICFRFGRKKLLLSTGPLILLAWALIIFTRSLVVLYLVRFLQGVAMGVGFVVAPMYIAETSEPRIRGTLSGQFQTLYFAGTLIAYCTGPYLSYNTYAFTLASLPILFLITFCSMPESPYYLLMVNRTESARKSLNWLRGGSNVEKEFNSIRYSVEEDMKQKGGWKDLIATRNDRKSLFIVLLVCLIKFMNGMTALTIYASQTLAEATHDIPYNVMTVILGVVLVVTSFISAFLSDIIGRRPLLISSTAGCTVFCTFIAIYQYIDQFTDICLARYSWIYILSMISFCVMANIGIGPLVQTLQAEYFPSRTRSIGGAFAQTISSFAAFLNVKLYENVSEEIGTYFNYIIFAFVSLVGTIALSIILKETAGKSLGQIQKELKVEQDKNNVREECNSA